MPGVSIQTATRTGRTSVAKAPSGTAFFVGQAERGSVTTPVLITGLQDFEDIFGVRIASSHLHDTVQTFFEEGGSRCYVLRTVGSTATSGTLALVDAAAATCLTIAPASPGAWSSELSVVVTATTITVLYEGVVKELFTGVTTADFIAAAIGSSWVTLTAGTSTLNPVVGTFAVSAGTDGTPIATDYVATANLFDKTLGDGSIAIPGIGTAVHAGLIAHAKANNRIALLDMGQTDSIATLTAQATSLNSEYAGLFAPWVQIATDTGTRFIPPVGYIAGVRNRVHEQVGAFAPAAGEIAVARFVVGLAANYSRADGDTLDAAKVNAIRLINGTIRNYGWRSLSSDAANYALLTGRDLLNRLVFSSESVLEQFVFKPIDGAGHLLSQINGSLIGVVEPYRQAGGLFELFNAITGERIDPGYLVETGNNINSLADLAANIVKARLSVRIAPSAALISVTIVKVGLISGL